MFGAGLNEKFGKDFKAGEIIFCEFEPGNDFYLIQRGKVKISKIVKNQEKTMDVLGPGDIFGEMAILEEAPRSASAIAVEEVSALHFNRENFVSLMSSQPQLAFKLVVVFAHRIYDAKRRLMILLLDDVPSKIADVFLMLAEKEANYEQLKEIVLLLTMEDIANWCGQPVQEVQTHVHNWVKMGKIELYPDKIIIPNLSDFKRIVQAKRKTK